MKKSIWVIVPFTVIAAGCAMRGMNHPQACSGMPGPGMMRGADANGDGMLSKDEFMKFHEAVFDQMKNKDGVIDMKSMPGHGAAAPGMMGGCGGMRGQNPASPAR